MNGLYAQLEIVLSVTETDLLSAPTETSHRPQWVQQRPSTEDWWLQPAVSCLLLDLLPPSRLVLSLSSFIRQLSALLMSQRRMFLSAPPLARRVGWSRAQARLNTLVSA